MRAVFPAEMYKDDLYRVVHSQEEEAQFARLGWLEEIPVGRERSEYKVHHHNAVKAAHLPDNKFDGEPIKRGPGRPPLAHKPE